MKPRKRKLDPNLDQAFAPLPEPPSRDSIRVPGHPFDGEIPTYVFMRTVEEGGPGSAQIPRERARSSSASSRSEPDLPEIGSILDKYRIEEMLGRGGFAVVYRATHLLLRTPVAIKLLRPRVIQKDPSFAKMLCEEARYAARINHPNVVRVQDVTYTPAITYVVMEFIDGATLARLIERGGPLPPDRLLRVGIDIASGLRAGYDQGLIHRDIKPANVLISRSGVAKIVDLGLAHPLVSHDTMPSSTSSQSHMTPAVSSGVANRLPVVGTPAYMAPEQSLHPENVDFRADVYSLGVTLFHAATGQIPFHAREPARCIELHRTQPVPRPESLNASLPAGVADLIVDMMAKQPGHRPASYGELLERMTTLLREVE